MNKKRKPLIELGFFFWQKLSYILNFLVPFLKTKGSCRFFPTCSDYARQAISRYGMIHGVSLVVWRLLRCHSFSKGGYDPVK